jgi:uncharacterized protein (TIGR02996 family)
MSRDSELRSLLQAAKDEPDDGPRLVLADWLADHGEPDRAELIRLSLRHAQLTPYDPEPGSFDPRRGAVEARLGELLRANDSRWLGEIRARFRCCRFVRGLVEVSTWPDYLDPEPPPGGWDREPWLWLKGLRLKGSPNRIDVAHPLRHGRHPCLAPFTRLDVRGPQWGGWDDLAESPHVAHFRHLQFDYLTGAITESLPQPGPGLCGLVIWDARYSEKFGDAGVRSLVDSPHLSRLRRLSVRGARMTDAGVRALAASPALAGVTDLDLGYNRITGRGLRALVDSAHLTALRKLRLHFTNVGDAGFAALAASTVYPKLTHFSVFGPCARVTSAAVKALAGAADLPRLEELELSGVSLSLKSLRVLTESPLLAGVCRLGLNSSNSPAGGGAILASSPHLGDLESLDLTLNEWKDKEVISLLEGGNLASLRWLDVGYNEIGAAGAAALADPSMLPAIEGLTLTWNPLGREGWAALGASKRARLTGLCLRKTAPGPDGVRGLLAGGLLSRLHWLELSDNALADQVKDLLDSGQFAALAELDLSSNGLTDEHARLIASCPHLGRLRRLHLNQNAITEAGLKALLESPHLSGLAALSLHGNQIGAAGIGLIHTWPRRFLLEVINLHGNPGINGWEAGQLEP